MPVTLPAHAAAILPFVRFRALHPVALVCGTVAPDTAYLVGWYGAFLHTPMGVVLGCVPIGMVALLWAEALFLPAMRATLPRWGGVQWARFAATRGLPRGRGWLWAALSVLLGAATHIAWDGFTHRRQWPASALYPQAVVDIAGDPMRLTFLLQWLSSIAGTALVAGYLLAHYRHLPATPGGRTRDFAGIATPAIASAVLGAALRVSTGSLWNCFWGAASAGLLGLTAACVLHRATARRRSESPSSALATSEP